MKTKINHIIHDHILTLTNKLYYYISTFRLKHNFPSNKFQASFILSLRDMLILAVWHVGGGGISE